MNYRKLTSTIFGSVAMAGTLDISTDFMAKICRSNIEGGRKFIQLFACGIICPSASLLVGSIGAAIGESAYDFIKSTFDKIEKENIS